MKRLDEGRPLLTSRRPGGQSGRRREDAAPPDKRHTSDVHSVLPAPDRTGTDLG